MQAIEVWKPVNAFEGYYEVSSFGNVRSVSRTITHNDGVKRSFKQKRMTQKVNERGYLSVGLNKENVQFTFMAHNLVAMAFIENPDSKPIVNHKDLNKNNNHKDNLEWVTHAENIQHAFDNGAVTIHRGEKNHMHGRFNELNHYSKPVYQFSFETKTLIKSYPSAREAGRQLSANYKLISECCQGYRNTHKGFAWSFDSSKLPERNRHR